jgi:hypothetical protein
MKKIDLGFVTFLNKNHKAFCATKYNNSKLVRENEDDEVEIGE